MLGGGVVNVGRRDISAVSIGAGISFSFRGSVGRVEVSFERYMGIETKGVVGSCVVEVVCCSTRICGFGCECLKLRVGVSPCVFWMTRSVEIKGGTLSRVLV